MSHKCPASTCMKIVADAMLLCRTHWFMLTSDERKAVYESYHENGPGAAHIQQITPILKALEGRL